MSIMASDAGVFKAATGLFASLDGAWHEVPLGGVVPQWNPTALPNLSGWFDATDLSTFNLDGSAVEQWRDKSLSAYHLNVNTQRMYRTAEFNGLTAVDKQPNQSMKGAIRAWPDNLTVAVVATPPATPGGYVWNLVSATQYGLVAGFDGAGVTQIYGNSGALKAPLGTLSGLHTMIAIKNGTNITSLLDGAPSGSGTIPAGALSTSSPFFLGASGPTWAGSAYQVAEIVIVDAALSGADLNSLSDYLVNKWGTG